MKDEQKGEDIEIDLPTTPIPQEKEEKSDAPAVMSQAPTKSYQSHKHLFDLIDAIKTLQKPSLIDPLVKQAFDDYIVEIMQKNRNTALNKKPSVANSKIEESDPKLPFVTTKESVQRSSLKSQLSMKSSTRKARDEQDKMDSIEQIQPPNSSKEGQERV